MKQLSCNVQGAASVFCLTHDGELTLGLLAARAIQDPGSWAPNREEPAAGCGLAAMQVQSLQLLQLAQCLSSPRKRLVEGSPHRLVGGQWPVKWAALVVGGGHALSESSRHYPPAHWWDVRFRNHTPRCPGTPWRCR